MIETAGGEGAPVIAPGNAVQFLLMPLHLSLALARAHVQDPSRSVVRSGSDLPTVGREDHAVNVVRVSAQCLRALARLHAPDFCHHVFATRDQPQTVNRERQSENRLDMTR